jgi:hypothetical protein
MNTTNSQYVEAIESCKEIFIRKTKDYGTSWRVLRNISIVDQIFIKTQRIRTIQTKTAKRISDNITDEFQGIVNYCVIALIQLQFDNEFVEEMVLEDVEVLFDLKIEAAKKTMLDKNHDYGEAWRSMSQESFADLILMKLLRVKQILANDGKTLASEGIDANFIDIINYSLFALILIREGKHNG